MACLRVMRMVTRRFYVRTTGQLISHRGQGIIPNLTDATVDPDGVRLVSVFSLMIEAWLSKEFAPEATESRTGVPASRGETIGC